MSGRGRSWRRGAALLGLTLLSLVAEGYLWVLKTVRRQVIFPGG